MFFKYNFFLKVSAETFKENNNTKVSAETFDLTNVSKYDIILIPNKVKERNIK